MIWATVSSWSCFCWLYRTSPSLAAKNIIILISVLTIWWCPCVESSLVLLEECFVYWYGRTYFHFILTTFVAGKDVKQIEISPIAGVDLKLLEETLKPAALAMRDSSHLHELPSKGGPGKEWKTNKLPPSRKTRDRSKGKRNLQSICPANLPESSLESILAEPCTQPERTLSQSNWPETTWKSIQLP